MQGHVSSYDTADGRRWRYAVTLGRQHYRRCERCDTRTWRVSNTVCDRCGRPLGPISEHPARRQTSRRGFKTKKQAEREMREVLAQVEADTYTPPTSWTVGGYLSQWIAGYRGSRPRSPGTGCRSTAT